MNSGKTINYKAVESEFLRLCSWAENNYTNEDIIRAIKNVTLLAAASSLVPRTALIIIEEGRGNLPSDFQFIDSVASTNAEDIKEAEKLMCNKALALTWVHQESDSFLRQIHTTTNQFKKSSGIRFRINQNYIFMNFDKGVIGIAYKALPVDEDGFPELIDHASFLNAAVYDCALAVCNRMFMQDKISGDKRVLIEGYRNHYVSQAGASYNVHTKPEAIQHQRMRMSDPMNANPHLDFWSNFSNTYGLKFSNY